MKPVTTILFDLDGTLLDTAPDLGGALNRLLQQEGKPALPPEAIREVVSDGGNALVSLGFGTAPGEPAHDKLYQRLLALYSGQLAQHTCPFPGITALLSTIRKLDMSWGIVTNKPSAYTLPLLKEISFETVAAAVVCPDDVKQRKPHPEAMYRACEIIGCKPEQAVYVGDHQRDIEAGRNAGMVTVAALYGYIAEHIDPYRWHADLYIKHPDELAEKLQSGL